MVLERCSNKYDFSFHLLMLTVSGGLSGTLNVSYQVRLLATAWLVQLLIQLQKFLAVIIALISPPLGTG